MEELKKQLPGQSPEPEAGSATRQPIEPPTAEEGAAAEPPAKASGSGQSQEAGADDESAANAGARAAQEVEAVESASTPAADGQPPAEVPGDGQPEEGAARDAGLASEGEEIEAVESASAPSAVGQPAAEGGAVARDAGSASEAQEIEPVESALMTEAVGQPAAVDQREAQEAAPAAVGDPASSGVLSVDELMQSQPAEEPVAQASQSDVQLRAVLEAIIYVAEEPLTSPQIAASLHEPEPRIRALLQQLMAEFDEAGHGVCIREIAGGFKMATKAEHHDAVRNFVKGLKPPLKLSLPALETLSVIAYKQPVTGPEIMEIRGVQGGGVLKTLLDRKLIAAAGRKNVIGKPILYKTTKEFLIQFGLKDLAELPSLKEFEEIRRMAFDGDPLPGRDEAGSGGVPDAATDKAAEPPAPSPEPQGTGEPPADPTASQQPESQESASQESASQEP